MELVETTISEHIYNQGKAEGLLEGEAKGVLEGQLAVLADLHRLGILSEEQVKSMTAPLQQKLNNLLKGS